MKVSKKQLFEAIESCDGITTVIARKLGKTQQAINKRIKAHQDLKQACKEARDRLLDDAESEFARAVRSGSPWAIKFILSTLSKSRGKSRAYITGVHVEGNTETRKGGHT